ncbi:hypothetical protein [Nodosilinea sp. P-1105]|uniref:hypothetical protein n=1 Tax=Nodosilinea sp. P-1105 TaxID=2546229 RepID=UPI00146DA46C|nr:hypothetical protein [Nodosilinea sp. P-1105]NMF83498.1 hypothetical protein [Nodosilinea sp. P-1105]
MTSPLAINCPIDDILGSLWAYGQRYGLPERPAQRQGLVATLCQLRARAMSVTVSTHQLELWIQQVLAQFESMAVMQTVVDAAQDRLAQRAYQWQTALEQQVRHTLNAYVQRYAPDLTVEMIQDVVVAAIPLLDYGTITKAEVHGLVDQLAETFDVQMPLRSTHNPVYIELAATLATVLRQNPLEEAVKQTVTAYVSAVIPRITRIGADLIANALSAILNNQVNFGIDVNVHLVDRQLLIQQVSFKLNTMEQSPIPSKSAEQMAAELHQAVADFLRDRDHSQDLSDPLAGLISEDGLSISSPWTSTRTQVSPETASSEPVAPDTSVTDVTELPPAQP